MVNTELIGYHRMTKFNYNILNIVVNTERSERYPLLSHNYNILNIVVNTEPSPDRRL